MSLKYEPSSQPPFCVHRVHSERGMFDFFTQKDETRYSPTYLNPKPYEP